MIKQIQLRGISRTPSDKMSEDGGLSESLNMYLDTAESAPALVPEDVTEKLGLPADLEAERIFIHKTANYENYIVVQEGRIVAYTPGIEDEEPLLVMELAEGETVNDITSVGNTLVVSTVNSLYYILYKDKIYSVLGNSIPFPLINFKRTDIENVEIETSEVGLSNTGGDSWFLDYNNYNYIPSELNWNANSEEGKEHTGKYKKCIDALLEKIRLAIDNATTSGYLTSPVFMRYEVDIYGSSVSSMPILLPSTVATELLAKITTSKTFDYSPDESDGGSGWNEYWWTREQAEITSQLEKYKIFAQATFDAIDLREWKEIISSVKIYMSQPIDWGVLLQSTILSNRQENLSETPAGGTGSPLNQSYTSSGQISFRVDAEYVERLLEKSSLTYLIKEIPFFDPIKNDISDEIKTLMAGEVLDIGKFINTKDSEYTQLQAQKMLSEDDMKHYALASDGIDTYNNKLLLTRPSQIIDYDYNRLNSYDQKTHSATGKPVTWVTYDVTYLLKAYKKDKVVKKQFTYTYSVFGTERIYAFQIFPDSRAYKMLVKATKQESGVNGTTEIKYGEFDMLPHPYLDCAYYYGGIENELVDLCTENMIEDYPAHQIDDLDNKLLVSEMDKPFYFPLDSRYTFQSKIIGVAVATTTLSQGQFGQFPLYVFTEDGIWAMETAADGSFVSQKPLSREVCINPDSICSIDNAVVFVTSKAVMMIQGSQVMNISPYMNGRHYTPNESALNIISKQDGYDTFLDVISDDDPFMSFMKDAKVAYDYTGQRLIFISPSNEGFQYVYKIDTQTWHKFAFSGFDLSTPLNSYPECLVMAERQGPKYLGNILEYTGLKNYDALKDAIKNGKELNKIQMAEEPFPDEVLEQLDVPLVKQEYINYFWWKIVVRETRDVSPTKAERDNLMRLTKWSAKELDDALLGKEIRADLYFPEDYWGDVEIFLNKFFEYEIEDGIDEGLVCIKYIIGEVNEDAKYAKVYSLSTVLDASTQQDTAKGILITRPFDLGMPDVYKSITNIKIRGDFDKGNVKYILQGSNDGRTFYTLNTLRGKSWRMFRIFILADLEPTERISWIDVDFEPRYNNRLR